MSVSECCDVADERLLTGEQKRLDKWIGLMAGNAHVNDLTGRGCKASKPGWNTVIKRGARRPKLAPTCRTVVPPCSRLRAGQLAMMLGAAS